ncbi:MAG: hypothetical protein ACE5R6_05280 [Candidatus Heimdallarchaeota archaeon]
MIKSVLMMDEAGLPIFSFDNGDPVVDHALITAFFTAMHNITKEVFLDSIQTLEMGENQLVFGQRPTEHAGILYGAIISDVKDHPDLIAEILDNFLETFATKYENEVQIGAQSGIRKKFEQFELNIKREMKKRLRRLRFLRERGNKTRGLGLAVGLALFFLGMLINLKLWGKVGREVAGLNMVVTLFLVPSGVAGWVTGNGRDGLIAASASGSLGALGLAIINVETLIQGVEKLGIIGEIGTVIAILAALLVLAPAYGLIGYICGAWVSRRCLSPPEEV